MSDVLTRLLADGAIIPLVILAGYALLFKVPIEERYQTYVRIIMAGLTAYLLAKLLGSMYQPQGERPFEILGVSPGASYLNNPGFPSDHALFAAFLVFAVWFATKQRKVTIVLVVLTLLLCIGRVLALVHTPLDVLGGIVVASAGALWYVQTAKVHPILSREQPKPSKRPAKASK